MKQWLELGRLCCELLSIPNSIDDESNYEDLNATRNMLDGGGDQGGSPSMDFLWCYCSPFSPKFSHTSRSFLIESETDGSDEMKME
jgi:hypothetical protein